MIPSSRAIASLALVASGAVHFGVASLNSLEPRAETAGGAEVSVARLGNSFQDLVQGQLSPEGATTEVDNVSPDEIEPVEPVSELEPLDAETTAPLGSSPKTEALEPEEVTAQRSEPNWLPQSPLRAEPVISTVTVLKPVPLAPPPADSTVPHRSTAIAPLNPEKLAEQPENVAPEQTAAMTPTPAAKPLETTQAAVVEDVLAALPRVENGLVQISRRPPKVPERNPEAKPAKPRPATPKAPAGNSAVATNETRGTAEGQQQAQQASKSERKARASQQAGNAEVSNYPGLVLRKISRMRKPKTNNRGTATIAFTIATSGAISTVRVARSSGSSQLDQLALQLVQRAGPFPKPPLGAQRQFQIGIKGR